MNTMPNLYSELPPTANTSGRAFGGRSQSNIHSIVPSDIENMNNDDWNGPSEYKYCCPGRTMILVHFKSPLVIVTSILWPTRLANTKRRFIKMMSCQLALT